MVRLRSTMATFLRSLAAQIAPFWPAGPLPMTTKSYSVEFMHELAFEAQPTTRAFLIACEDSGLLLLERCSIGYTYIKINLAVSITPGAEQMCFQQRFLAVHRISARSRCLPAIAAIRLHLACFHIVGKIRFQHFVAQKANQSAVLDREEHL